MLKLRLLSFHHTSAVDCTSTSPIVGQQYFHPVVGQALFCKNGDEDDCVLSSSFRLLYITVLDTYLYIL